MYKEAELGLNDNGGGKCLTFQIFLFFMANFKSDTPSCPFDCNCCKSLFSCVIILLLRIVSKVSELLAVFFALYVRFELTALSKPY